MGYNAGQYCRQAPSDGLWPATPIPHGLGASHAALPRTHHEEVNSRTKSPNRRNRVNTKEATTKPTSNFAQVMLAKP
jgi:hypothetical protein